MTDPDWKQDQAETSRLPPKRPSTAPPADLAARIELYLEDAPSNGDHSDKAGGNCWELLNEAMEDLRRLAQQPVPRGEPPLAKLLKEVDPGLAEILTDNAAWVALIRNNVVTACANIANAEFESGLEKIQAATDDKALSDTGRREIQQRADAAALSAQRIASRIRGLAIPSTPSEPAQRAVIEPFRCYCRTQFERSHCAYFKDGNCGRTQYANRETTNGN